MSYLEFDSSHIYSSETSIETEGGYYEHYVDLGDLGSHEISIDLDDICTDSFHPCLQSVSIEMDEIASVVKREAELNRLMWELLQHYTEDNMIDALSQAVEGEA